VALVLCVSVSFSLEAMDFHYASKAKPKVGEWTPPTPPMKESPHLSGRVPPPEDADELRFQERALENNKRLGSSRKLLMSEAGAGAQKVPHNWFGTGKFKAPAYSIATGKQECDLCKKMISNKPADGAKPGGEAGSEGGASPLCEGADPAMKEMCDGYDDYLEKCPSFIHDICHQDVGGGEQLRSPCPDELKCYYCLRINPIYCL
jgi:hypothetical protein